MSDVVTMMRSSTRARSAAREVSIDAVTMVRSSTRLRSGAGGGLVSDAVTMVRSSTRLRSGALEVVS